MDKSIYFKNGGIRIKNEKVIINILGKKSFLPIEEVLYIQLDVSETSQAIRFRLNTKNQIFQLEGEKFIFEDADIIKKEIEKLKNPRRSNANKNLEVSSISEFYISKGDIHGDAKRKSKPIKADEKPSSKPKQTRQKKTSKNTNSSIEFLDDKSTDLFNPKRKR